MNYKKGSQAYQYKKAIQILLDWPLGKQKYHRIFYLENKHKKCKFKVEKIYEVSK